MIAANLAWAACDDPGESILPKPQCGALLGLVFVAIVDAFGDAAPTRATVVPSDVAHFNRANESLNNDVPILQRVNDCRHDRMTAMALGAG
jgi:hypothetical protein